MKSITTKCIILGHKNFGETDKLIFLYSDELGKIKVIAKGARRITSKFTGHLETLNFCIASLYFGPRNTILTEIITDKNYLREKRTLRRLKSVIQIAEITNQMLFENQSLENLSKLIQKTILHTATSKKPELISIAYIIKLLDKVGLIPDFKQTSLNLEEKYLKFFNFIKKKSLREIENITLTKEEKFIIQKFVKELIQEQTNQTLVNL